MAFEIGTFYNWTFYNLKLRRLETPSQPRLGTFYEQASAIMTSKCISMTHKFYEQASTIIRACLQI